MSHLQAGHLGDLGAALVDDQLSPETRDAALAHLASCEGCQREVEQQRRLKARLRCLAEPSLPLTLALRLSALKPDPAPTRSEPPSGLATALAFPIHDRSRVLSQRRGRLLAGAASLLLFGVGTAYAAAAHGQPTAPTGTATSASTTSPSNASTTLTASGGSLPLNDPALQAMTASFVP